MDTKFQNKGNVLIFLFLAFLFLGISLMTSLENKFPYDEYSASYFHDNEEIKQRAIRLAENLQRYYIYYADFDSKKAAKRLSELEAYLNTHPNESRNDSQPPFKDYEQIYNFKPEYLYSADASKYFSGSISELRESLAETLSKYNATENYLKTNTDFHYCITTSDSNTVIDTNSENFSEEEHYEAINLTDELFDVQYFGQTLSRSFHDNNLRCFITIPKNGGTDIRKIVEQFDNRIVYNKLFSSKVLRLVFLFFGVGIIVLLAFTRKKTLVALTGTLTADFMKIPLFIKIPILCFLAKFILVGLLKSNNYYITDCYCNGDIFSLVLNLLLCTCTVFFSIMFIKNTVILIKNPKQIIVNPEIGFINEFNENVKITLDSENKVFFFLLIITALLLVSDVTAIYFNIFRLDNLIETVGTYILLLIAFGVLYVVYKFIASEIRLRFYIEELSKGTISSIPPQSGIFSSSINKLEKINQNFRFEMEERLKSERMKTDLITNVSHDLKTPLTSIISYVDLLIASDIKDENEKYFIDVIKQKASRLKVLIDDLFEASKLSSGQMKLEKRVTDIRFLLEQTLGELDNVIADSDVEFITQTEDSPVLVETDGQKMWRVFDNLISNILKYSAKGSRAYIYLKSDEEKVTIDFKNVSNYKMDFDSDELFERFKRGDKARSTEGSGLGLSIAKSIVELHGGSMRIETEGDLFKVRVTLQKYTPPKEKDETKVLDKPPVI